VPVQDPQPPFDIWGLIVSFVVALVSATISILKRVLGGQRATWLWVFTEYLTAILCGYLAYHAYPTVADSLPTWVSSPLVVAIAAHSGGRIFQELEAILITRSVSFLNPK
jgi:hypothetical protein